MNDEQDPREADVDVGGMPGSGAEWSWRTPSTSPPEPTATDGADPPSDSSELASQSADTNGGQATMPGPPDKAATRPQRKTKADEAPQELPAFLAPPVIEPRTAKIGKYRETPVGGLAELAFKASNGQWKFHNNKRKRIHRYSEVITQRRLEKGVVIASVAYGGGLGKTTSAVRIAQQLKQQWDQNVLIIDMNTAPGTLPTRLKVSKNNIQAFKDGCPDKACWTFEDVWRLRNELDGFPEVNWRFAYDRKQGLFVLAGEIPSERTKSRFVGVNFLEVMDVLRKHFAFIVLDCGTSPWEKVPQQILSTADVFVIPTTTSYDRLEQVADIVATMQKPRLKHQLDKLVIVTNRTKLNFLNRETDRAMDTIQEILASDRFDPKEGERPDSRPKPYTGPVINMPWRRSLARGRAIKRSRLNSRKSVEAMQITAAAMQIVFNSRPVPTPDQATAETTRVSAVDS